MRRPDACGGSRARAYAMTGDYLAEEPFCAHVPKREPLIPSPKPRTVLPLHPLQP